MKTKSISIIKIIALLGYALLIWIISNYASHRFLVYNEIKELKTNINNKEDSILLLLNIDGINNVKDFKKEIENGIKRKNNIIYNSHGYYLKNGFQKNLFDFIFYWEVFDQSPVFRDEDKAVVDFCDSGQAIVSRLKDLTASINDVSKSMVFEYYIDALTMALSSENKELQLDNIESETRFFIKNLEEYSKFLDFSLKPCTDDLLFNLQNISLIRAYVVPRYEFERIFKPLGEMKKGPELYRLIDTLLSFYLEHLKTQ
jgi:Mg2+ and Co2+ transporter CorA